MRKLEIIAIALLVGLTGCGGQFEAGRQKIGREKDFNFGWIFKKGDIERAAEVRFETSGWRKVNLPHDWSIEGPFSQENASGTGYLPGGIGWYRKTFELPESLKGKVITVEFDGVYNNSEVWINGELLGKRPYGYSSFQYDLTKYVNFGKQKNVLAVRVDHSKFADSRWYTGSGIYRNVRLIVQEPVHIAHWGTFVTTPQINKSNAQVRIETTIKNDGATVKGYQLESQIIDSKGRIVGNLVTGQKIAGGKEAIITQQINIKNPQLWDIESPALYQLKSTIREGRRIADSTTTNFGIRSFRFDADKGFFLNGKNIKFKGVCIHHDGGAVGAAVPIKIWESRFRSLKEIGVNAIRTSHNPPAPEFLDLCDAMGFLVMDEAFDEFTPGKNKWVAGRNNGTPSHDGYNEVFEQWSVRDAEDMVKRDRNHPSIIIWSIGNEIDYPNDPFSHPALGDSYRPGNPPAENMPKYGKPLVAAVKRYDTTRPVTAAMADMLMSNAVGFADIFDVAGYNYQEKFYVQDHNKYPKRCIIGSENSSNLADWEIVEKNDFISGQFIWSGFDYLGESSGWPNRSWTGGLFDLCGFKKPNAWFRQSLWTDKPFVYIVSQQRGQGRGGRGSRGGQSQWNWSEGANVNVSCYTNCDEAELFLNGESLGSKSMKDATGRVLSWSVPYKSGELKAVGKKNGKAVCEYFLKTAGKGQRIELLADTKSLKADGKDVSLIEFRIVDANGVIIPNEDVEVEFTVEGPSKIIGIGNANSNSTESFQDSSHLTFQGRGQVILQSERQRGKASIKAAAEGLKAGSITVLIK